MIPVLTHAAAYRFVALTDADAWRARIEHRALEDGLTGTVLLAGEGINLAVAGAPLSLDRFFGWLQADGRFAGLPVRRTPCAAAPYRFLRVRVKPEIIRMDRAEIRPQDGRAPSISPDALLRWMSAGADDAGRPLLLLDTRNAFEVAQGRLRGAWHWSLQRFSDFPAAATAHAEELRGKAVVSYCTGGIRCEKAALFLAHAGIADALQLDGGILHHFETAGGAGYDGRCVVFDDRLALSPPMSAP